MVTESAVSSRLLSESSSAESRAAIQGVDYTLVISAGGYLANLVVSPQIADALASSTPSNFTAQSPEVCQRLYEQFQDVFDFIVIASDQLSPPDNAFYAGITTVTKNQTTGIGLPLLNRAAGFGSAGRLLHVQHLPVPEYLSRGPSLHEMLHLWGAYLPALPNSGSHWGFSSVGGQLGGWSRGTLRNLGTNLYHADNGQSSSFGSVANGGNTLPYSAIELYVMGLVPPSYMHDVEVALSPSVVDNETFTASGVVTITAAQILSSAGSRTPDYTHSQRAFRGVFVIVSKQPLNDSQLSVYDSLARAFSGFGPGSNATFNFWLATGGRAALSLGDLPHAMKSGGVSEPARIAAQSFDGTASAGGTAQFAVHAQGSGSFTFQWQQQPANAGNWTNAVEGSGFRGTQTQFLTLDPVTTSMDGVSVRCIVGNSLGTDTSTPVQVHLEQSWNVETVADSLGIQAAVGQRFDTSIGGVAVDQTGNVYVPCSDLNVILKITPAGVISRFAGAFRTAGTRDGDVDAARFDRPWQVSMGPDGDLFVADRNNRSVRKISRLGIVTTIAGASVGDNTFSFVHGVAVDPDGNVYATDLNHVIRKISPNGLVTIFAGALAQRGSTDGTGGAARFNLPDGIACDRFGNVYVSDSGNRTLRLISPTGVVTTLAGRAGEEGWNDGAAEFARFNSPSGLTVDRDRNVYVTDRFNMRVRKISPDGFVSTPPMSSLARVGGMGSAIWSGIPNGLASDSRGNLFVTDGAYVHKAVRLGSDVPSPVSRLTNLSVRSLAGSAERTLIVGYSVAGRGTKQALIRGIGPSLAQFGLTGALPDPQLRVFDGDTLVAQNDDWRGTRVLTDLSRTVGAFELSPTSKDAAVSVQLTSKPYTAQVTSTAGTGVALVEVYDADSETTATHFTNFSARNRVDPAAGDLVIGFVIAGSGAKKILIRGVGPSLSQFGVTDVLADPVLSLFDSTGRSIGRNDDWSGESPLANAASQVGAFPLPATSKDAALLVTLPPGVYTAQVSGANATGVALVEVYEVP